MISLMSCSADDDVKLRPDDERKYPHTHVNPTSIDFTVYQAAAFCGDGYSNQIQIWTSTMAECECLLDNFIDDCNEGINNLTLCHPVSSKYPPLASSDCN